MARFIALLILAASLSACVDGSNPFDEETTDETATTETETETETEEDTTDQEPIASNTTTLPGTVSPTSTSTIVRREEQSSTGDGYAEG
jgi:hypothetical protein